MKKFRSKLLIGLIWISPLLFIIFLEVLYSLKLSYDVRDTASGNRPVDTTTIADVYGDPDSYSMRVVRKLKEQTIWDATYRLRKGLNNRIFLEQNQNREASGLINLFGGSFTFGVNLEDGDTLAGYFSSELGGRFSVNNFGIPGAGPHNILEFLDLYRNRLSDTRKGVSYFFFIDDHIPRSVMDLQHVEDMASEPFYLISASGESYYAGRFYNAKPWMSWFLEKANSFSLMRRLGFNPPLGKIASANLSQRNFVCDLLKGVESRVLKTYPNTVFKIVFLPNEGLSHQLLLSCLKVRNLSVINLTELLHLNESDHLRWRSYYFPDYHPRGKYNEEVVRELIKRDFK